MTDSMLPKRWARECGWGGDHGFLLSKYFWRGEQRAYFVLDKPHTPFWQLFNPDISSNEHVLFYTHFIDRETEADQG